MLAFSRNIRARTLSAMLMLVIPSIVLLNVSYYWFIADLLEKQAMKDMRQLTHTIGNRLDDLVRNMDRIAINIAFSQELLEILERNETLPANSTQRYNGTLRIKQLLQQVNELTFVSRNIYIFTKEGSVYDYGVNPINPENAYNNTVQNEWIDDFKQSNRNFMLSPPQNNPWDREFGATVFSLKRPLQQIDRTIAVIEVQQDYEKLSNIIANYGSSYNGQITVADEHDNIIFPFSAFAAASSNPSRPVARDDEISYSYASDYTRWTTVMTVPKKELFGQVTDIRNVIIGLSALIVAVFIAAAFLLSRRLSAPIVKLNKNAQRITLDYPFVESRHKYGIAEIDQLFESFQTMVVRLRQSHEEIVQAGSRENQAYLKALQAQMNPHFLHNSLATIGTLAEEVGAATITRLSFQLSEMLRYSTDQQRAEATIGGEMRHVGNYLQLLQMRFEDHLQVTIDVDPALLCLFIPKLCIQPFVENAYIHGVNKRLPPWRISIVGEIGENCWTIRIADNGIGISDAQIRKLQQLCEQALHSPVYGEIGGLGVVNTYVRLRAYYGDTFAMEIQRLETGGTEFLLINNAVR